MTPARRPEAARRWLEEAHERLDHARKYQGGSRRILCEQAHYATEYAIKSVIIARGRSFPTVHDVGLLLNTAEEAGETIPGEVETASSLTTYAGEGRYGFDRDPTVLAVSDEEHREAVRQAERVVRWADERIDRLLGKHGKTSVDEAS